MPEDFLLCRAFQHNWKIEFAYGARDVQGNMNRNWSRIEGTCERCGMEVTRIYDPQFGLSSSTYRRPTRMIGGVVYHYDIKGSGHVKWKAEARQYAFERSSGRSLGQPAASGLTTSFRSRPDNGKDRERIIFAAPGPSRKGCQRGRLAIALRSLAREYP